jgi:hypothetical protein
MLTGFYKATTQVHKLTVNEQLIPEPPWSQLLLRTGHAHVTESEIQDTRIKAPMRHAHDTGVCPIACIFLLTRLSEMPFRDAESSPMVDWMEQHATEVEGAACGGVPETGVDGAWGRW